MSFAHSETELQHDVSLTRYVPVALTLVVGIALSLVGFQVLRGWEMREIQGRFERVAEQCNAALSSVFQTNLLLLETPRSLFWASEDVSRKEFWTFAQPLVAKTVETLGWEWLPRVPAAQRAKYEALARDQGNAGFSFQDFNAQGNFIPAARRDEYFPLYYLEPEPLNHRALGLDVATVPNRRAAMQRACDRGAPQATTGAFLVRQAGPPLGLLVFLPVYQDLTVPDTIAGRRQALRGFIVGAYRLDKLMEKALRTLRPEGVIVSLADVSDDGQRHLLHSFPAAAENVSAPSQPGVLSHRHTIDVAGQQIQICTQSVPGYVAAYRTSQPWVVLAAGLTLTGFLATRFMAGVRESLRIERLVAERTAELRRSEQDIRTILDTVQVGIAVVDAETRQIVDVNPLAAALLGGDKQQIVGRDCQTMICASKCGECSVLNTGRAVHNAECALRATDGRQVPVLKTVAPVTLSGKKYLLESLIDISERRRMEDALRASEEKFRSISDSALDAVALLDTTGNVTHWNPAAERITGYSREEMLGRSAFTLLAAKHQANARSTIAGISTAHSRRGATIEITAVRKDGSEYPLELSLAGIEIGGQWGAVTIGRDISARKATESELQRRALALELANRELHDAKHAAEAANNAKSEFLTNMSHELRTPLHGILSFAALGVRRNQSLTPEERLEFFQLIQQSGNNLLQLINALLDLAKLEAGRMDFDFAAVDLSRAIPLVVDELRSLAEDHRLKVTLACTAAHSTAVADRARLLQVVRNLLSNAIKFSPPGGTIELEIRDTPGALQVAVRDEGIGIPESELETIFDKFIQSSKTRNGAGGTGLGLAICREIIHAHGGRMWAANRSQCGAELVFEIPRHAAPQPPRPPSPVVPPIIVQPQAGSPVSYAPALQAVTCLPPTNELRTR
jgi:PAS domain S-box-containing protein